MQHDYRLGKLRGGFCVVWNEGGKRHRYKLGTSDPREARAALHEFIRGRRTQRATNTLTVADHWHDYVAEKRAEGRVSVPRMADSWKRLGPCFGGLNPGDITPSVVRSYIASRRQQSAGDGTIHIELGYLRACLRHALRDKAPHITLPSKPRPRTRGLSAEEANRLIDAAQVPHLRLYLLLALFTAGRPSSILGLTWDRVDFDRRGINLDDPTRDRTAKGRALVPMAERLVEPLLAARAAALTDYVIEWAGKPVKSIKKGVQRAGHRARVVVTPYVLRHTAAIFMVEGGTPMSEVSQFLGHTSTAVTERVYGRYSPEHLRRASNAISERLNTVDTGGAKPNPMNAVGTNAGQKVAE